MRNIANKISNVENRIKWLATFGHEKKEVDLCEVHGTGGSWHLYINHVWYGAFIMRQGEWVFLPYKGKIPWLTAAEMQILPQLIADFFEEKKRAPKRPA